MCLIFLVIGYMGSEIKTVLDRNPTISTTSYFTNLIRDHTPVTYNSSIFDFALLVTSVTGNATLNEDYDRYISLSVI